VVKVKAVAVNERHLSRIVIPSEARDLQFAAECRSLAALGMTKCDEFGVEKHVLAFTTNS
jgi:hypothetical protein